LSNNIKLYKKTPMNIGLFLFERTMDHRIITKKLLQTTEWKKNYNYDVIHRPVSNSIVNQVEQWMQK